MATQDQFAGCLLGLALGDAMGAPFEGGRLERFAWKLIGKTGHGEMRWTDDTQMSVDLAESLIANGGLEVDHLAQQFGSGYRWSRGYGPAAAKTLKKIKNGKHWHQVNRSTYPDGSFGNGGAMRAPIIGIFYNQNSDALIKAARDSAFITHAHPLGIEGAVLIASAAALALGSHNSVEIIEGAGLHCEQKSFIARLIIADEWLCNEIEPSAEEVAKKLGNSIAADASCVTSLYICLRFLNRPFKDMINFVIECSGDVDTIGAMAGAIWGARRGASNLPEEYLERLEQRSRLNNLAISLFNSSMIHSAYRLYVLDN